MMNGFWIGWTRCILTQSSNAWNSVIASSLQSNIRNISLPPQHIYWRNLFALLRSFSLWNWQASMCWETMPMLVQSSHCCQDCLYNSVGQNLTQIWGETYWFAISLPVVFCVLIEYDPCVIVGGTTVWGFQVDYCCCHLACPVGNSGSCNSWI